MRGLNAAHHQRDPRPFLQAAIAAAERAARRDTTQAQPWIYLGNAWGDLVDLWETPHGLDPRPSLEKSIAAYREAGHKIPDPDTYQNLGVSLLALARWQLAHGIDAVANLNAAVDSFEAAIRMQADEAAVPHANACGGLVSEAWALLAVGRDPAAWLGRAQAMCDAAKREAPGNYGVMVRSADFAAARALAAARTGGDPEPGWQRAIADAEAAMKIDGGDPDAPIVLVHALAARAEYAIDHPALDHLAIDAAGPAARAVAVARDAVGHAADSSDAHAALARADLAAARVALHAGRPAAASILTSITAGRAAAARALAINADAGAVLLTAAELALLAAPRDPKARAAGLDALARALTINPHDTRALVIRAGFERLAGHADLAAVTLRDALAAGPLLAGDPAAR
jgi:hypothetical protein